jgi:hypothetical protein
MQTAFAAQQRSQVVVLKLLVLCVPAACQLLDAEVAVPGLCAALNLDAREVESAVQRSSPGEVADRHDSHCLLRRGQLLLGADVYNGGTEYKLQVRARYVLPFYAWHVMTTQCNL